MLRITQRTLFVSVLLSLVPGCKTEESPVAGPPHPEQPRVVAIPGHESSAPLTMNERLAIEIAEFGGAFFDNDGVFSVYLTDLSRQSAADPIVRSELRKIHRSTQQVRFLKGQYTYLRLKALEASLPALGPGLSAFGIDTKRNRYLVQAVSPEDVERMKSAIVAAGLPLEAFIFEVAERVHVLGTKNLTDKVRPLLGGLKVSVGGRGEIGSATAVVWYNGTAYLLIASHVADTLLEGQTGQTVYQPTIAGGNSIGTVSNNPPFTTSNCQSGYTCRDADAALADAGPSHTE